MKEITFMICSNGTKESVTYPDDLLLGTVIRECADHGIIVQNSQYLVTKEDDRALNLNRSLADNGIVDGDVLYVGSVTKAGANNEEIIRRMDVVEFLTVSILQCVKELQSCFS